MHDKDFKTGKEILEENISTKVCPYCEGIIPYKAVKCMHCSEWIENDANLEETFVNCPHCNELIPLKAVKCMHCGKWIKEKENKYSNENSTKPCPYCDSKIHSKATKCRYCGEWVTKEGNLGKIATETTESTLIGEALREGIRHLKDIWR